MDQIHKNRVLLVRNLCIGSWRPMSVKSCKDFSFITDKISLLSKNYDMTIECNNKFWDNDIDGSRFGSNIQSKNRSVLLFNNRNVDKNNNLLGYVEKYDQIDLVGFEAMLDIIPTYSFLKQNNKNVNTIWECVSDALKERKAHASKLI